MLFLHKKLNYLLPQSRVLRLQLELTQVKADIDRKLQEKEEEFDSTRYSTIYPIIFVQFKSKNTKKFSDPLNNIKRENLTRNYKFFIGN